MIGAAGPGYSGKATVQCEVLMHIKGVVSSIERTKLGFSTQIEFGLRHQWQEVALIGVVEGLRHLSQHNFTPFLDLGRNHPRSMLEMKYET